MELPSYFTQFIENVRLTAKQKSSASAGHKTLRDRLANYEDFENFFVSTFLQGSYRRATGVRPVGEKRADVDVVFVTKLSNEEHSPSDLVAIFKPFLDKFYKGAWELQGRSFGINLFHVDLDL